MRKCIAIDLDGTLSESTTDGSIGNPIKAMVDRVKSWNQDGLEVVIFTARAGDTSEVRKIESWLKNHQLPALNITNVKDSGMVEIWDNLAIRVANDKGDVCGECNSHRKREKSISSKYNDSHLRVIETDC